jgi:glucose-1-phosphate thymidylyltransferase
LSSPNLPLVGLIPAGGSATRLGLLPCSKELLPVGFFESGGTPRPRPVCLYLIERLRAAGIERAFVILRPGKWDIPAYLGDGAATGVRLAYLTVHNPTGAPYTLDQARPFLGNCRVALGLPDIIFEPVDAYRRLAERQEQQGADLVLGLFPTDQPHKADMVHCDEHGRAQQIQIKPTSSTLRFTWMIALWTPAFTEFLGTRVAADATQRSAAPGATGSEFFIGHVFQAAIDAGLHVDSVTFPEGTCLDIGTPENLREATRRWSTE